MIIIGIFKLSDLLRLRQTLYFLTNIRLKDYIPLGGDSTLLLVYFHVEIEEYNSEWRQQEIFKCTVDAMPIPGEIFGTSQSI